MGQIIETKAKILHFSSYDKRNKETKELTGEKGYKVDLLLNSNGELKDASVLTLFPSKAGGFESDVDESFKGLKVLEQVGVVLDVPLDNKGFTRLVSIRKIKE